MARVTYGGGVDAFNGSIAGTTFQRNPAGNIARTRSHRAKGTTERQSIVQVDTYHLLQEWRQLALGDQTDWNDFAALNTRTDFWGQTKKLSGFNFYVTVNSHRLLAGVAITNTPAGNTLPEPLDQATPVVNVTTLQLDIEVLALVQPTFVAVYLTQPIQRSSFSFRQWLRLALVQEVDDTALTLELTAAYAATGVSWPPSDPIQARIGIAAYTFHSTSGFITPATLRTPSLTW